jgi:diadenylate cyclase
MQLFITFRLLDLFDILLVAFLMYQIYLLIRGTVAINIFVGIFLLYLIWLVVKALNMQLLSLILGQFIGVGMIALIIVFQQELRKFFLMIGTRNLFTRKFSFEYFFSWKFKTTSNVYLQEIVNACENLSQTKTGALIVLATRSELRSYIETGEELNATITSSLLENIFFKNSPLHDGAVIIEGNKIKAAKCVLPVLDNIKIAKRLGMRHRSAMSMAAETDAVIIVVSEETGYISLAKQNDLIRKLKPAELLKRLEKEYT